LSTESDQVGVEVAGKPAEVGAIEWIIRWRRGKKAGFVQRCPQFSEGGRVVDLLAARGTGSRQQRSHFGRAYVLNHNAAFAELELQNAGRSPEHHRCLVEP
jgi:hypothetical protein